MERLCRTRTRAVVTAIAVANMALLAGCGGTATTTTPSIAGSPPAMLVTPRGPVFPGDVFALTVIVGSQISSGVWLYSPAANATWTSSNPLVVDIGADGSLTARSEGSAQLTAHYQGQSASTTVSVLSESTIVALEISCPASIAIGQKRFCTAAAILGGGLSTTAQGAWSSSRPDVAVVDSTGSVTAVSAGETTVTAMFHGRTAAATITVQ